MIKALYDCLWIRYVTDGTPTRFRSLFDVLERLLGRPRRTKTTKTFARVDRLRLSLLGIYRAYRSEISDR